MQDSLLKALQFNFKTIVVGLFLFSPSVAISQNFIEIKNIFLFCPGCTLATSEPCSVILEPMGHPLLCDDAFLPLLQSTVILGKQGKFGPNLQNLPSSADSIFESYRNLSDTAARHELVTLLLLSSAGQEIVSQHPNLIVESNQTDADLLSAKLHRQLQVYVLDRALSHSLPLDSVLLDAYLARGLLQEPDELLINLGIDSTDAQPQDVAHLSRLVFPYSPHAALYFGEISETLRLCSDSQSAIGCLNQITWLQSAMPDYFWKKSSGYALHGGLQVFQSASDDVKWRIVENLMHGPREVLTPNVLAGLDSLINSASGNRFLTEKICTASSLFDELKSLDSGASQTLTQLCSTPKMFSSTLTLIIGIVVLGLTYVTWRIRKLPKVTVAKNLNSTQLSSLSESYNGERRDLLQFFGVTDHSSVEDLNRSFRNLAKTFHPDSPTGNESTYVELRAKYERVKEYIDSGSH